MTPDDLRAFALRDWAAIDAAKAAYWAGHKREMSLAEAVELGGQLRQYVRSIRPDWPTPAERDDDLASHIRVAGALGAVSRTSL